MIVELKLEVDNHVVEKLVEGHGFPDRPYNPEMLEFCGAERPYIGYLQMKELVFEVRAKILTIMEGTPDGCLLTMYATTLS